MLKKNTMKKMKLIMMMTLFFGVTVFAQDADTKMKNEKIVKDAKVVKAEMLKTNPEIAPYFDDAKAYVIFPNVGKGAMIVGAASGHGVVYERGVHVGMASMKQVDIGLQAGGEAYGEVIFFKTDSAIQEFMDDNLEFTAQVSAVVIKEGGSINLKYDDGIAVFTMPKGGLMAEASVGGQKFEYDAL